MNKTIRNSVLILVITLSVLAPISLTPHSKSNGVFDILITRAENDSPDIGQYVREAIPGFGAFFRFKREFNEEATAIWTGFKTILGVTLLTITSWLFGISALLFDRSLTITVKDMGEFVNSIGGIDIAWRVIRDLVNMVFIFALLYIAIATILRIEEYGAKRLLTRLIIIALLINFSLFFTKAVIDASNILSSEFIEGIENIGIEQNRADVGIVGDVTQFLTPGGIAGAFAQPLQLATIYSPKIIDESNVFTIGLAGSIFLLIAAFIFFAAAILLIIRFVILIFLMVTSPIAFAGMILPKTKDYAHQWWNELFKQAIWVPVYMALLLVVAVIVNDPKFVESLTNTGSFAALADPSALSSSSNTGPIDVVLNFIIVSGLMIAALVTAQKMGAQGAATLSNLGKRIGTSPLRGAGKVGKWWFGEDGTVDRFLSRGSKLKSSGLYNKLRRGGAYITPYGWKRSWSKRTEEKKREDLGQATGERQDLLNRVFSLGHETTDFGRRATQVLVNDELKDITTRNQPELIAQYKHSLKEGNAQRAMAYLTRLAQNYDLNEVMSYFGKTTNHAGLQDLIKEQIVPLVGEDEAYRMGYDLSRIAEDVNHINYARAFKAELDPETGRATYEKQDPREAEQEMLLERQKKGRREQVGLHNRLGQGFSEFDLAVMPDGTVVEIGTEGSTTMRFGFMDTMGEELQKTEAADREYGNQMNANARLNGMLKSSQRRFDINPNTWLMDAENLAGMSDEQLKGAQSRIAAPIQGSVGEIKERLLTSTGGSVDFKKVMGGNITSLGLGWSQLENNQKFTIENARKAILRKLAAQKDGTDTYEELDKATGEMVTKQRPKIDISDIYKNQQELFRRAFHDMTITDIEKKTAEDLRSKADEEFIPKSAVTKVNSAGGGDTGGGDTGGGDTGGPGPVPVDDDVERARKNLENM